MNNFWMHRIAGLLKNDGVIICPTDTIYGFTCSANSCSAMRKILRIKRRLSAKGFILLAHDLSLFKKYVHDTRCLARIQALLKQQQQPTTYVVRAHEKTVGLLTGFKDTVAIRYCPNPLIAGLCKALNAPVLSSSANISSTPYANHIFWIHKQFFLKVDYVGHSGLSNPSSVWTPSRIINLEDNAIIRL